MLPANCLLSIFTNFYLMRIQVTWVFIINLHESILMPITERASSKYYTMAPDSDILYLYGVSSADANGRLVNSSMGVGNDKNNIIYGTDGAKSEAPGDGDNWIDAGAGNDTVFGYAGNDIIHGGDGNDRLDGGAGGDVLYGGAGNDVIFAGNGDNSAWYYYGDGLGIFPGIARTRLDIAGDTIDGGDGDDRIYSDGYDVIYGGAGNDRIFLQNSTHSYVYGGDGNDRFFVASYAYDDVLGYTDAAIHGGDGIDTIVVTRGNFNLSRVDADVERVVVQTTVGSCVVGRLADETILGGTGNDTLIGGGGKDRLVGNDGDDTLQIGHLGRTNLVGGNGVDTFYFTKDMSGNCAQGADDMILIQDFEDGVDKIRFGYDNTQSPYKTSVGSTLTQIVNTGQSFSTLYNQAKSVHTSLYGTSVAYFEYGGNTYVVQDKSSSASTAEFSIRLTGVHNLTMSDFLIEPF